MKFRRPTVENKGWTWWLASALGLSLLLGVLAYWGSVWLAPPVRIAPAGTLSDQSGPINISLARSLFGDVPAAAPQAAAPVVSSNIKVLGILAAGARGSAVLSVDGKPGKAYAVGDTLEGGLRVLGVDAREVRIGSENGSQRQTLAAPPRADLAVLTRGPAPAGPGAASGSPGNPAGSPLAPPLPASGLVSPPPAIVPPANPAGNAPVQGLPPPSMQNMGMPTAAGSVVANPAAPPPPMPQPAQ